jgi:hypothetical protein
MQFGRDDEFRWFFGLLRTGLALVFGAFLLFGPAAPAPPSREEVFGCYSAENSQNIRLDAAGMHVLQTNFPAVGFHLERSKQGILLTAEAPIRADATSQGYRFGVNSRGAGSYLPFYRVQNGRTYAVFEESDLRSFQMLAGDGATLRYEPVDPAQCAAS